MKIILNEPKNEIYVNLISLAFKVCNKFAFIRHSQLCYDKTFDILINELNDELIEYKEQNEWPGTISIPTATVYYFRTTEKAKKIIENSCISLYDWRAPNLPDDLCFFKNEKAWLINTSHERFSEIETDDKLELEELKKCKGLIKYAVDK